MRLARKMTLLLLAGVLAVVAAYGYIDVERQVEQLEQNMGDELSTLAHAAGIAVAQLGSDEEARRFLDAASRKGDDDIRLRELRSREVPRATLEGSGELRSVDGDRLFVYRLLPDGKRAIEASQSLAGVRAAAHQVAARSAWSALLIVVLGALYTVAVGLWCVGRPVRKLIAHLRRVGAGDLYARVSPLGNDELGELGRELDRMTARLAEARSTLETEQAARLAAVEQLRHADRLTTVGTLAAGVAHELGTPLNVVAAHAKLIAAGDEPAGEGAVVIGEQTSRMTAIIRQLLDFARRGRSQRGVADLAPVVARTLRLLETIARRRDAQLCLEKEERPFWALVDEAQIQQVLTNLVLNGLQAMKRGGRVTVAIEEAGEWIRVRVTDQGEGISDEELPRIFEPFYTTKAVGEGTGLGLSVSYGIVREHGGFIDVASEPGCGSSFAVHLPRAAGPTQMKESA